MAKGQRISQEQIEVMRAYLATGNSLAETARRMGLPKSTVATWKKRFEAEKTPTEGSTNEQARTEKGASARVGDGRTFEELRTFNKERFIEEAGDIVVATQELIRYNLQKAYEQRQKIDDIIDLLHKRGEVLTDKEFRRVMLTLLELKAPDIGKLSSVMGTMYDKRALANGEPTENVGGVIKFEDL